LSFFALDEPLEDEDEDEDEEEEDDDELPAFTLKFEELEELEEEEEEGSSSTGSGKPSKVANMGLSDSDLVHTEQIE
jgi:hypothetical protein